MTDAQRNLAERWGLPPEIRAEVEREGIDLTLLVERLRLTPTERLLDNERMLRFIQEVRHAGVQYRAGHQTAP